MAELQVKLSQIDPTAKADIMAIAANAQKPWSALGDLRLDKIPPPGNYATNEWNYTILDGESEEFPDDTGGKHGGCGAMRSAPHKSRVLTFYFCVATTKSTRWLSSTAPLPLFTILQYSETIFYDYALCRLRTSMRRCPVASARWCCVCFSYMLGCGRKGVKMGMDVNSLLVILIPSVLAIAASLVNIILSVYRERKKDEDTAWDAAKDIVLRSNLEQHCSEERDAEEVAKYFNHLYKCLKSIKTDELQTFLQETEAGRSRTSS